MRAARKPESGAPNLTVPERVLLFCIAPDTDLEEGRRHRHCRNRPGRRDNRRQDRGLRVRFLKAIFRPDQPRTETLNKYKVFAGIRCAASSIRSCST
jgi:hypothetical protein